MQAQMTGRMLKMMEKKINDLLEKYGKKIGKFESNIHLSPCIPEKKLNNAIKSYAQCVRHNDVLALCDNTLFGGADNGFIITKKGVWYKNRGQDAMFFLYQDLSFAFGDEDDLMLDFDFDIDDTLIEIILADQNMDEREINKAFFIKIKKQFENLGTEKYFKQRILGGANPEIMEQFLEEMRRYSRNILSEADENIEDGESVETEDALDQAQVSEVDVDQSDNIKCVNSEEKMYSTSFTNAVNANHLENDAQFQKYHNQKAGHGFAAEDANSLNDRLSGRKVENIGRSNELNGPDRIVDGKKIQTKYYATSKATFNASLDKNGYFRYDGQMLEVPKDQYNEVRAFFQNKIDNGELLGQNGEPIAVSNADEIVKEGSITYIQAKNISKAGNIDSIKFDIKNQTITTGCIMGMSIVLSTAINIWNGKKNFSEAAQDAMLNAFEAGKTSMFVGVLSAQALRTKTAAAGTVLVRPAVKWMYKTKLGKVAIEKIVEASLGKVVTGGAAINHMSKLLRSNIITGGISVAAVTAPGFYRTLFDESQSWTQLFKDMGIAVSGVIGGAGGWAAGAVTGGAVGSTIPLIGTATGSIVGGITGALAGGAGASFAGKKAADKIVNDDSVAILEDIKKALDDLATDYLLTEFEFEKLCEQVRFVSTDEWLRSIYKQGDSSLLRRKYVYLSFTMLCDSFMENRVKLHISNKALEEQGTAFIARVSEALSQETGDSR